MFIFYLNRYHIVHKEEEKKDDHHDISSVLLYGKKYILAGFAALAVLVLAFKALILPLKFWFFLKIFAIANTFLAWVFFFRFFRLRRLFGLGNLTGGIKFKDLPIENKNKLQTIKDILNSDDGDEGDMDYKTDDEDVRSKESLGSSQILSNPFNSTEAAEEFVQNLLKLVKLKNKNW